MIKLTFEFSNYSLDIPINPENLEIATSSNNETYNIIGVGDIIIPAAEGLKTFSIESFFPASNNPKGCVKFFQDLINTKKPARFITQGMTIDLNMLIIVNEFSFDTRAGEEEDIYYSLSLSEYRTFGAKLLNVKNNEPTKVLPTTPEREDNRPNVPQTYIVKSGDNLWKITKSLCGDGDKWGSLYNANKAVIGNNPNLIYPGQVLTLPSVWEVVSVPVISTKKYNTKTNSTVKTNNSVTASTVHTASSGRTHGGGGQSFSSGGGRKF